MRLVNDLNESSDSVMILSSLYLRLLRNAPCRRLRGELRQSFLKIARELTAVLVIKLSYGINSAATWSRAHKLWHMSCQSRSRIIRFDGGTASWPFHCMSSACFDYDPLFYEAAFKLDAYFAHPWRLYGPRNPCGRRTSTRKATCPTSWRL